MELIKTEEGYYVPKEYLYYEDGEKRDLAFEAHVNAPLPSYGYDEETKKWCLVFFGADFGGYDVQEFTVFFDSEEDLLKSLKE